MKTNGDKSVKNDPNLHVNTHNLFLEELSHHFKFTAGAVLLASIIIVVLKYFFLKTSGEPESQHLFEGFFISHLFFASLTPSALFSIYNRNLIIGVLLSVISSSLTCSLSDIVFPYLGGLLLNYDMEFHLCVVEEPVLSWIFIFGGALSGYFLSSYVRKLSRYTHSAHIFLSSLAAGMYLITFGVSLLSIKALIFVPILIISVLIPCVMNDIGVPSYIVSLTKKSESVKKKILESLHKEHHGHKH